MKKDNNYALFNIYWVASLSINHHHQQSSSLMPRNQEQHWDHQCSQHNTEAPWTALLGLTPGISGRGVWPFHSLWPDFTASQRSENCNSHSALKTNTKCLVGVRALKVPLTHTPLKINNHFLTWTFLNNKHNSDSCHSSVGRVSSLGTDLTRTGLKRVCTRTSCSSLCEWVPLPCVCKLLTFKQWTGQSSKHKPPTPTYTHLFHHQLATC